MSIFRPFQALLPKEDLVEEIIALPYDCMNSQEAREIAEDHPLSFLHVSKAEIDLPEDADPYGEDVYRKAAENLQKLQDDGALFQDDARCFYILTQEMNGRSQTGLVGCASIDDYQNNVIKKHEKTRYDKEIDRINHIKACNANTGAIFLTYRAQETISDKINAWKASHPPDYDFQMPGRVHTLAWRIDDEALCQELQTLFAEDVDSLYIADGHHRCASAAHVGTLYRQQHPDYTGDEEFNYFLAVAFPSDELSIMDYNRVARLPEKYTPDEHARHMTKAELFRRIEPNFVIESCLQVRPFRPEEPRTFGMYYGGSWYKLTAKDGTYDPEDPVGSLDVAILQNNLIEPVLGIDDPRGDPRIDFVGGIRGLRELEKRVSEDMEIAFSMYPTSIDQLMSIADAHELMPPKSTWFEPKLPSGLFLHLLTD